MNITSRYSRLLQLYARYDEFCGGLERHCRKGCDLCCTANVTVTTLEAGLIAAHCAAREQALPMADLYDAVRRPRFQPAVTMNRLAELCALGKDAPEEAADPAAGPCALLDKHLCPIYDVRPFGCRAMQSLSDCGRHGAADMPEVILSANTLFLQFIEALDPAGASGNLADLLIMLNAPERRAGYEETGCVETPAHLPVNRSIPVLMIPPQHRRHLQDLVASLRQITAL